MRRFLVFLVLSLVSLLTYSQTELISNVNIKDNGTAVVTIRGFMESGWHFSTTEFYLEGSKGAELQGNPTITVIQQGERQKVTVTQNVKCDTKEAFLVNGYFEYVICSDEMCIAPQTVDFTYHGKPIVEEKEDAEELAAEDGKAESVTEEIADIASSALATVERDIFDPTAMPLWKPIEKMERDAIENGDNSNIYIFFFGFIGGLLALLTPCIWPMIPLTLSFFMKQKDSMRNAITFGISIIVIYMTLAAALTLLFGANAMNTLSTSAIFNIACFLFLFCFGLSFMGVFTLRLPSSWGNMIDSKASKVSSGLLAIFLMALTLVVVSFSCTAPIVGTLLVQLATTATDGGGNTLGVVAGMFGFSLALALPFMLFALFPSVMKVMPRSGDWMTHIKVSLGMLEIAFSLKFLSVADMAYGWDILPRPLFMALWVFLFLCLATYYAITAPRLRMGIAFAVLPFALSLYLLPGISGAPRDLVAAFSPPAEELPWLLEPGMTTERMDEEVALAGGESLTDFDEAIEIAERLQKPVLIDFTGYGCVNCRKMEGAVLSDKRIQKKIREDYIYVQLYVDDRTPLEKSLAVNIKGNKKHTLRTVGDKWSLLESYKFGSIAQPLYVIISPNGSVLAEPYGFSEDTEKFLNWLDISA